MFRYAPPWYVPRCPCLRGVATHWLLAAMPQGPSCSLSPPPYSSSSLTFCFGNMLLKTLTQRPNGLPLKVWNSCSGATKVCRRKINQAVLTTLNECEGLNSSQSLVLTSCIDGTFLTWCKRSNTTKQVWYLDYHLSSPTLFTADIKQKERQMIPEQLLQSTTHLFRWD